MLKIGQNVYLREWYQRNFISRNGGISEAKWLKFVRLILHLNRKRSCNFIDDFAQDLSAGEFTNFNEASDRTPENFFTAMILMSLWFVSKERFEKHRRLVKWTLPIWFYVSLTSLIINLMLYHR